MPSLLKDLKTGIGQIEFELDEAEYCAIGRVTAHWAYLEHGVYAVSLNLANQLGVPLPEGATKSSFTRRLGTLTELGRQIADDGMRKKLESLIGRIANAEQERHRMTHGIWDWDRNDPEALRASSFRPGYEFEKRYDASSLHALADRIAQISFALEYPEGWNEAFRQILEESTDENGIVAYASESRHFARRAFDSRANRLEEQ